jgi:hypothetical protein
MFDQAHQYDLAFVPGVETTKQPPEIVIIISKQDLLEVQERLRVLSNRAKDGVARYLHPAQAQFVLSSNQDGNYEFGYEGCGYWTEDDDSIWMRIRIGSGQTIFHSTLTLCLLILAVEIPFLETKEGNRRQQTNLYLSADRYNPYGHAIGGFLDESVVLWLGEYAKNNGAGSDSTEMPPEVIKAMQETWCAMYQPKDSFRKWLKDIRGTVRPTGHFYLECFGNACDLSVYPENRIEPGCEVVTLSCHNLDSAGQQLTLMAGLAKICEMARNNK